ncbi:App1 family protein [Adhaeribacter terreus]|uniref:App1 family protein n=1 Tax=Adhaeribacter terreus TaxID=529703 RepID=A0ABW0E6Q1_9BACT
MISQLKKLLLNNTDKAEDKIDGLIFDFRNRFGLFAPLQIVPYRSYGTPERLYVTGRVLADKNVSGAEENHNVWDNLWNMYKRFDSDEVPNAQLVINFDNVEHEVVTDEEGYFTLNLKPEKPLQLQDIWHPVEIKLKNAPVAFSGEIKTQAEVLVPPPDAEYGIISDIDDTVIQTGATSMLATARNVFFNNARTRLPFAGVSAFYKSLQLGRNGKRNNPFFYVSSSPWNTYDLLRDFLDLNEIPGGPILLRDLGIDQNKFIKSDHLSHKMREIENILITYPKLSFVLIGDSGQEDARIYEEVVKKHPGRILAIYIRDVKVAERSEIVVKISEGLKEQKVEMLLIENTVNAAEHAAKTGLIFTETIPEIKTEKAQDKGELPGKEEPSVTQPT